MFPIQITSLQFFLLSLIALVLWHAFYSRAYRLTILTLISLPLIGSYLTVNQAIFLGLNLALGYLAAKRLQQKPSRPLLYACLLALIGCFLAHKDVLFPGLLGTVDPLAPAAVMGYSLVFFKLIHLLIDAYQQTLRPLHPLTYTSWLLAFFTWLAGPIIRYNDYAEQVEEGTLAPAKEHLIPAFNRLINGLFRLIIICPFLKPYLSGEEILQATTASEVTLYALAYFYGYYIFIYMNFSGYCDVVLALSQLFGLRLPENFKNPFSARNLLIYWRLWHVTLSEWFQDYIFTPLFMNTVSLLKRRHSDLPSSPSLAHYTGPKELKGSMAAKKHRRPDFALPLIVAYSLTFLGTGLWHGLTLGFMLFGLTHAVGCIALRLSWPKIQQHVSKAALQRYKGSRCVTALATVCTHTYVAFSLLFFAHPLGELQTLAQHLWHCLMS